jgi:hypothetical protein
LSRTSLIFYDLNENVTSRIRAVAIKKFETSANSKIIASSVIIHGGKAINLA